MTAKESVNNLLIKSTDILFYIMAAILCLYILDDVIQLLPIKGFIGDLIFLLTFIGIPVVFIMSVASLWISKEKRFKKYSYWAGGGLLFILFIVIVMMRSQI